MEDTRKNTGTVTSEQILLLLTPEQRDRAAKVVGAVLASTVTPLAMALAQEVTQYVAWAGQALQDYANSPEGHWLRESPELEVIDRKPIDRRVEEMHKASLTAPRAYPIDRVVELYEASRAAPPAYPINRR